MSEDLPDNLRTRCEIYTRVMGYHRPVEFWNKGKQQEHAERRYFAEARLADGVSALHSERSPAVRSARRVACAA